MGPPSSRSAQEGEAARGATAELKWPLFADARHVEENGEGMGDRGVLGRDTVFKDGRWSMEF